MEETQVGSAEDLVLSYLILPLISGEPDANAA